MSLVYLVNRNLNELVEFVGTAEQSVVSNGVTTNQNSFNYLLWPFIICETGINRFTYISSSTTLFSNQLYTDGMINKVSRVDEINPPTTTVASGF